MSTVRIPPMLRQQVGGAKEIQAQGATVGEALQSVASNHPGIGRHLFAEEGGQLQRFVNVYVNDQDIQYLQRLDTPVSETDTIIILPAMAGGSG